MEEMKSPNPSDLDHYGDWLNEEIFKERKGILSLLITISTALLGFTISFRKDVAGLNPQHLEFLKAHWLLLLITILLSVIYYYLEVRFILYQKKRKIDDNVSWTHYAGRMEGCILALVVYTTPATFLAAVASLTIFVLLNTH